MRQQSIPSDVEHLAARGCRCCGQRLKVVPGISGGNPMWEQAGWDLICPSIARRADAIYAGESSGGHTRLLCEPDGEVLQAWNRQARRE